MLYKEKAFYTGSRGGVAEKKVRQLVVFSSLLNLQARRVSLKVSLSTFLFILPISRQAQRVL